MYISVLHNSARFKEIVKLDVYDEDLVSEESLAFTKSQSNTRKLLLDHMRQRLGMGAKDDSTECSDGSGGGGGSGSGSEDDSADEWVTSSADAGDETNVGRRGLKNADLGNFSDDGSNDDYCDGSSDIGGIYGTEEESDEEKSTPRKKNGEEKDTCKDEGDESNDPNVSTSSNALAEIRMTGFYHDPIHGPCVSVKTQTMAFGYKELQTLTVRSIRAHTAVTRELSDFLVVKQEDFLCTGIRDQI